MSLNLPAVLVATIAKVVLPEKFIIFTLDKTWLYTAMSPESFNEMVEHKLVLLQAQYGFNPPEHEDWVHPAAIYTPNNGWQSEEVSGSVHPLNAMILKNPVSFVPSFEDMLELAEHIQMIARGAKDRWAVIPSAEELHDNYVERICLQLQYYESLLQSWRDMSMPREQSECLPLLRFSAVKKILINQRSNLNAVKNSYESLRRNNFPQFMLDRYLALIYREQKILDGLLEILRYAK